MRSVESSTDTTYLRRILFILAVVLFGGSTSANALPIVNVKPIQVCNDAGASCANAAKTLLEAETDKIWAQASIDINFLAWGTTNETDYLLMDDAAEVTAFFTAAPNAAADPKTITMWFVDHHFSAWGQVNMTGGNKVIIDDEIFAVNRIDTIGHEIGHLLGLLHTDPALWQAVSENGRTYVTGRFSFETGREQMRAAFAITGAAPVPVPPPIPAVMKHMCAPSRCPTISSIDSSAAAQPTSGFAPAPSPSVTP